MKRIPKFFCEFCGTQVKQNDRICHHCGKFFSSVKCPSCGFTGESGIFREGCPLCGYAVTGTAQTAPGNPTINKKADQTDPLPWWIYFVSLLFLGGLVAFILFRR